uniref:Copia protein n=1 Tax=Tanacetum cinerariifolium TaxID=118510 RepID=A0A6L2J8R7_TANCI|nr:copia protein [Tanacetum cinerariifolium]
MKRIKKFVKAWITASYMVTTALQQAALHRWYYMVFVATVGKEYDKVFNHLDILNAPFEEKVFTCAKQVKPYSTMLGGLTAKGIASIATSSSSEVEYIFWTMKMEQYLAYIDYDLWEVILNGNNAVQMTKDEADEHLARFHGIKDAKTLWATIKTRFGGNSKKEEWIDYAEVFALVARIEAIRIFLAFVSYMGFIVYQIDVKNAFLYSTIEDEVYVSQPLDFIDPQFPNKVYKVKKARSWYETLSTFLLQNGYRRGTINKTLFIKKDKEYIMLVQVYVDDIIFGSTKKSLCDEFEAFMHKRFQMSSMGELTFFLELQVKQSEEGIFLSQDKDSLFDLEAYSNSDYAGANLDRKSITGGCQFLGRRLISWKCKKQTIVATSTTEAEYVAVAHYCGHVLWIQNHILDYDSGLPYIEFYSSFSHSDSCHSRWQDSSNKDSSAVLQSKRGDSLVRAATTASLDAHQDSSNITKTQSNGTLNEPTPQGEGSGSGLGHQEIMGGFHPFKAGSSKRHGLGRMKVSKQGRKNLKSQQMFQDIDNVLDKDVNTEMIVEDKGNGEKGESELVNKSKKMDQDQIERDAEVALKIQADLNEEPKTEKERQEEASKATLADMYDEVQAQIYDDYELAVRLTLEEQEKYTVKERNFEEIQKSYIKEQKWVDAFVPIGSEEDEKRMEVERKEHQSQVLGTNEVGNIHVYKLTRLDGSYKHFSTFSRMLKVLDRQDILDLHKIIMERFLNNDLEGYDLILWGDLKTLVESSEDV